MVVFLALLALVILKVPMSPVDVSREGGSRDGSTVGVRNHDLPLLPKMGPRPHPLLWEANFCVSP